MPTNPDTERATALYEQLKPDAQEAYWLYYSTRTPAELQTEMRALVEGGLTGPPPPTDPTTAQIANGADVVVIGASNFPAPGSPGVAQVTGGNLIGVQLTAL